jgi:hypothetical protein
MFHATDEKLRRRTFFLRLRRTFQSCGFPWQLRKYEEFISGLLILFLIAKSINQQTNVKGEKILMKLANEKILQAISDASK